MLNLDVAKYHEGCARMFKLVKKGRQAIYLGGYDILGSNILGDKIVIDSRHEQSLKLLYVPPPIETSVIVLMFQLIKPGMICVDVGAGCGYYSILAAHIAGSSGKIYSFEPIPECFKLLQINIDLDEYETIVPIHQMVLNQEKVVNHSYFGGNYEFFFLDAKAQQQKVVEIQSTVLDSYFRDKETIIDFVKINTEKYLFSVIRGMKEIIDINPNINILALFNKDKMIQAGDDPQNFFQFIHDHQLSIFTLPSLTSIEPKELLDFNRTKTILLCHS